MSKQEGGRFKFTVLRSELLPHGDIMPIFQKQTVFFLEAFFLYLKELLPRVTGNTNGKRFSYETLIHV